MKHKIFTCWLMFSFCIMVIVRGQQPVYPIPGEDQAQYSRKAAPPKLIDEKNGLHQKLDQIPKRFPQTYFDTISKQFKVVSADPRYGSFSADPSLAKDFSLAGKPPASTSTCFRLTKDINVTSGSGDPFNFPNNNPYSFAVINNVSYFSADDGIHGRELWRSDGTAAGTYMVKDINPGAAWSSVSGIIAVNGLLYFSAATPDNSYEPWVSDGTESGTHLLKDLNTGTGGSHPNQFINVNGSVFFVASVFSENHQLWKTDGTEAGTALVKDIQQAVIGQAIYELTAVSDMVYFIAYTWSAGFQLFRSDGTDAGTYMVKQIGFFQYDLVAPMQLTSYDNKLYFSVDDGTGRRLWSSDGTEGGTNYAAGFNDVFLDQNFLNIYNNRPFPILNSVMYLCGNTLADGGGLYKYDASNSDGIVLVKDLAIAPGNSFGVPPDVQVVNNLLYFKVINVAVPNYDELWVTNGESSNTVPLKVFPPGEYIYNFYNSNGNFFFVKSDATNGNELWKSNGTDAGTVIVKDIFPGNGSSYPENLTFCNGKLLFRAVDNLTGGELWSSNGTGSGTVLVKDINSATTSGSEAGSFYKGIASAGNGVVFGAYTPEKGHELYRSDGTANGTVLLNDIAEGSQGSFPNSFIYKNGLNYFIGDNLVGTTIYQTNGKPGGLKKLVFDIDRDIYYVTNFNITENGMPFYILGNRNTGGFELWRSNATHAGSFMLSATLTFDSYIVTVGNTVYFTASDNEHGLELWKSDGTIAGTRMVKDIYSGIGGSSPYSLFVYKKEVYFGANDGIGLNNYQLWKSNGSEKGTVKLKNITPAYYQYVYNPDAQVFCISDNTLFFSATDLQTYGAELWKTNGTSKGTMLVKDINLQGYSSPYYLTDVNGTLYFSADDGVHGTELWSSRGTSNSTKLVKDIDPGYGSYPFNLCGVGNNLYFINSVDGRPWSSDGTANNTKAMTDPGLNGLTNFGRLVNGAGKLFFGALSPAYGSELFVGDVCATSATEGKFIVSGKNVSKSNLIFDALLYPNPSNGPASLKLSGEAKNVIVTIMDISGKFYWQSSFSSATQINLPVDKLVTGIYMVTVKSSAGNRTLKFVKQ